MRSTALVIRFLLELAALVALLYSGITIVGGALGLVVGVAVAAAAALVWGLYVAPRARIALATPARLAVELAVFVAATIGLFVAGTPVLGGLLIGLYLFDRMALWASGSPPFEPDPNIGPRRS